MVTEFWIEKAWGVSIDNATIKDMTIAIAETIEMDEEHAAFWVGHLHEEYVLEIHKNLELFFIYGENQDKQLKTKLNNWGEARFFMEIYFSKDFLQLINEIKLLSYSNKTM